MIHKLPLRWYDYEKDKFVLTTNLTKHLFLTIDSSMADIYYVQPFETLYSICEKLYNNVEYYWILAHINNITDVELSYILSDLDFEEYIDTLPNTPRQDIMHYEFENGTPTTLQSLRTLKGDIRSDLELIVDYGLKAVTTYEYERRQAMRKKRLIVLKKEHIDEVSQKLESILYE